jgi:hypothetical protein
MILLIYNEKLDLMNANSILKIFRDLSKYRDDVVVYKIYIDIKRKKYIEDIKNIVKTHNIKLILCVWSYLAITRKQDPPQTINIINYLNELKLDVKILCHTHDFCYKLKQYEKLENIKNYIEIGFKDQITRYISNKNIYTINHCATNNFKLDFNYNPINKILFSGGIPKNMYIERYNFYEYAKCNIEKIEIHNFKGYFTKDDEYPKILNNYIACYYSSISINELSDNRIILAKAFEIPATGSLLLADISCKESLKRVGFIEGMNVLYISENNRKEIIDYILDKNNIEKINEIRKNGMGMC